MPQHPISVTSVTFETGRSRTESGWKSFYLARDRFLHEQLRRAGSGLRFGTYRAPDGNTVDVWLTSQDISRHTLIVGATGTGKSSLLEAMAELHRKVGRGYALIDLHGDLFNRVAARTLSAGGPVTILDFSRPESLPSWNPLKQIPGVDVGRHVDLLVGVLKRLYAAEDAASWAWGVKVEEIMRHTLRACIESKTMATLVDIKSFLLIPALRQQLLATCTPETQHYFITQFGKREEMYVSAVLNKLDPFLSSIAVQRFLGSPTPSFDLFDLVDRADTALLINIPRGFMGPTADVVGRLLLNFLQLAVLRREAVHPAARKQFSILVDEAHNLAHAGSGLEDLLVSARKYRVAVALATQSLSLFPASFRPHLLGNTARQYFFRMPFAEAKALASDLFEPLGTLWREAVRPYDSLKDPLLTPEEEIAARTRDLANLPVGACYWMIRPRRYRARRIQVARLPDPAMRTPNLRERIGTAMESRSVTSGRVTALGNAKSIPTIEWN